MKASEYLKQTQEKETIEELPLPSGGKFLMRLAPIEIWTTTGVLPASLATKMQLVAQTKNEKDAQEIVLKHFTEQDFIDSQEVGRRMLQHCCVEPKVFILNPGEAPRQKADDEILPEQILPEDFKVIMKWLWSGGKQGESLAKFSRKPRQSSKRRAHR